jgi:hypothetical protein
VSAGKRRLSLSFALALCVGVAYFGLIEALIRVRVALAIPTIPHVAYRPVVLAISALSERPRATICRCVSVVFDAPLPPIPPLEIGEGFVEMIDERSAREVREFDAREAIRAFDATTIVM